LGYAHVCRYSSRDGSDDNNVALDSPVARLSAGGGGLGPGVGCLGRNASSSIQEMTPITDINKFNTIVRERLEKTVTDYLKNGEK